MINANTISFLKKFANCVAKLKGSPESDVKPSNILLGKSSNGKSIAKLGDF